MKSRVLVLALAGAALLPVPAATAAEPMKALIVHLEPRAVPSGSLGAHAAAARIEREGRRSQAPLLGLLAKLRREGHVRHVRSLWIANAVAVSADEHAAAALRARSDVLSIDADSVLPIHPADAATGEPGIAATGAPDLWSLGVDGRGITVATLDTGVDLTHAELATRYRGGGNSWFDPYGQHAEPFDMHGHGTQVMGVIAAGGGIGMAPGARFIAARVFNDAGVSTDSAVHLAFQWLLNPDGDPATNDAPNVVNSSWGAASTACDLEFQPDLQALRAAHILPVFAAGNAGPGASSDTTPANLPEAFAVGATANATTIAPFSSLGPSDCAAGQYPALVAPGTGIRSTDRYGFFATGLQGTSFSAPHAAGALALLLQVAPQLTAEAQASLLTQSAVDLGAQGPDSTFGAGALDAAAAARLLSPALDFYPPALSGAVHTGTALHLQATDAVSAIAGAEWWADADPGIGTGEPMMPADGGFDSLTEGLTASTLALSPGTHAIGMRARDAAGNWSAAAFLAISISTPSPPPAIATPATAMNLPLLPLTVVRPVRAPLQRVASDGFEHGLGAWPRRAGATTATRAAAITGRRGLRATSVAGAPAFVQRRLPHSSAEIELAFDVNRRTFSSAGAWVEIAAITGAGGRRLAAVELRSPARGPAQLRVSARLAAGVVAYSRSQTIRRQPLTVVLSLDSTHAALAVDGRQRGQVARRAHAARATAVALGPWHGATSAANGYLDIDNVTVRAAPVTS
jgi:subtilisin family serine protease